MNGSGRLANRIALVTGAADGIGRAITARFLAEGASVLAADLSLERLRASHGEARSTLRLVAQDVTAADAAKRLVDDAVQAFGGLDILVNNAGVVDFEPTESMRDDNWRRTLSVNLDAVFLLCQRAIPALRQRGGGRIINMASVAAMRGGPGVAAYSATKAAVAGLTRTLAVELGPDQITANYVCPGIIATSMTRPLMEADASGMKNFCPLGRVGQPEDVANAVAFLASDEAAFISGHGLVVDGGYLARM